MFNRYTEIDYCKNFKCEKGVCVSNSNGAKCNCIDSYYGDKCEICKTN